MRAMSGNVIFGRGATLVFPPVDCTRLAATELEPHARAGPIFLVNEHRAEPFQRTADLDEILTEIVHKIAFSFEATEV